MTVVTFTPETITATTTGRFDTTKEISNTIRSAECSRNASCLFADRIAQLSIDAYKSHCPLDLQDSYKQTVLAAFFIQKKGRNHTNSGKESIKSAHNESMKSTLDNDALEIVSFGVGTKVLPQERVLDEFKVSRGEGMQLCKDPSLKRIALTFVNDTLMLILPYETYRIKLTT